MRGFSLAEVVVVVAILGVVSTVLLTGYRGVQDTREPLDAARAYARALADASGRARAMDGDSSWGVRVRSNEIIVFKGQSYASRDASSDRSLPISRTLTVTGVTETVFAKFSGDPSVTGTTTFSSSLFSSATSLTPGGAAETAL